MSPQKIVACSPHNALHLPIVMHVSFLKEHTAHSKSIHEIIFDAIIIGNYYTYLCRSLEASSLVG